MKERPPALAVSQNLITDYDDHNSQLFRRTGSPYGKN